MIKIYIGKTRRGMTQSITRHYNARLGKYFYKLKTTWGKMVEAKRENATGSG